MVDMYCMNGEVGFYTLTHFSIFNTQAPKCAKISKRVPKICFKNILISHNPFWNLAVTFALVQIWQWDIWLCYYFAKFEAICLAYSSKRWVAWMLSLKKVMKNMFWKSYPQWKSCFMQDQANTVNYIIMMPRGSHCISNCQSIGCLFNCLMLTTMETQDSAALALCAPVNSGFHFKSMKTSRRQAIICTNDGLMHI